jgi:hypothetical protein
MTEAPRQLSSNPHSPHFDEATCRKVDKVFVDGVHVPNCVAYDMDAGWAFSKIDGLWKPKVYGVVTVRMK